VIAASSARANSACTRVPTVEGRAAVEELHGAGQPRQGVEAQERDRARDGVHRVAAHAAVEGGADQAQQLARQRHVLQDLVGQPAQVRALGAHDRSAIMRTDSLSEGRSGLADSRFSSRRTRCSRASWACASAGS
jgi:hypothetical protein